MDKLSDETREHILNLFSMLKGAARRKYMAVITKVAFDDNQSEAHRQLGWNRETIAKGASELRLGRDDEDWRTHNGGKKKICEDTPELIEHIKQVVEPQTHADPKLTSDRCYLRLSVNGVMDALMVKFNYAATELPSAESIRKILNRQGYTTRKVQKSKPLKRVPQTEQIFERVWYYSELADTSEDDQLLRLSIDAKARVKVGPFSRGGYSRARVEALDHDFAPSEVVVPVGLFLPRYGELFLDLYPERAPADAWVDSLETFWHNNQQRFAHTTTLVLQLDNGPENNSHRTQFLARLVQFSRQTGLKIILNYYPPYLSKYNPVERCWGVLEQHWSGQLLDSLEAVVGYASTMTYKGIAPVVRLVDKAYQKGVRLSAKAMKALNAFLHRDEQIPDYLVTISPTALPG